MKYFLKTLIICCGLLMLVAKAFGAEHWQNSTYIAQAFIEIALKNEYQDGLSVLRKWNQPVKVHLTYHVAKDPLYENLVKMHLAHLADITGHAITIENNAINANVEVVFTTESQWGRDAKTYLGVDALQHLNDSVCMATFQVDNVGALINAAVVIPVDQAQMHRKLVSCIVEEITQVMGLPNDSDRVYPSIFNDKTPDDLLTSLDGLLLKMLYHPTLKSGMTIKQVKPYIHQVITQWMQDGTVEQANKSMRKGALYPLLGYEVKD